MTVPYRPPSRTGVRVTITRRQADVVDGLCRGLTNQQIANGLGIEAGTVKTHLRRLMRTLGAHDRAHVVALALTGDVRVLARDEARAA